MPSGAGSPREPRLIDLRWGKARQPRVTLVGKGVCFDSGGLDIKPSSGMLLMKKDMGGAACALALAQMLMQLDAPIQLRVLIPAVENSVDGHAYRPGDVIASRKGLTVEIGNTDAEGRLVLADALAEADAREAGSAHRSRHAHRRCARRARARAAGGIFAGRRAAHGTARERAMTEADPGVADAAVGRLRR